MNRDAVAIAHYRKLVADYDQATRRIEPVRQRAIAALRLVPGETVVDVACGTGVSLPALSRAVGPGGRVVGVELSPDMLAAAESRVQDAGLTNVVLLGASIEAVSLPAPADAFLLNYTHDVLQSTAALNNLFDHARPGARVAVCGTKLFPLWLFPGNLWLLYRHRHYVTSYAGMRRPWRLLEQYCTGLTVVPAMGGRSYVASGSLLPRSIIDAAPGSSRRLHQT